MTTKATAIAIAVGADEEPCARLEATTESGETIEVTIPSEMFADVMASLQRLLLEAASKTGTGAPLLDVSKVLVVKREAEHRLMVTTDKLGVVGLNINRAQWASLLMYAARVQAAAQ